MKVIILAAGGGTRMLGLVDDLPKCLLPIGNTTILGHQLSNLAKSDFKDVIISAGYKVDKINAHLKNFQKELNIWVEYNPFFDISNNIMSLWNVRWLISNHSIIIINGDNVFDYQILAKLKEEKRENVLMVNKKTEYDGDDMKVQTINGRITKVNKTMKSSEASGESIGIMKFSAKNSNLLVNKLVEMSKIKENLHVWYLKAIQELINDGIEIWECDIENLRWQEVDFPEDYEKVKNVNWV